MNLTKTLSIALCALLGIGAVQAQYFDQEIDFQGLDYQSLESAKMVTDVPGTDRPYAVGAVQECATCSRKDISVTYFHQSGAVIWSNRYGNSNREEVANATVIGDFQDRIIVVGQVGNRDALIAAIEVPSGAVLWSKNLGTSTEIENLTSVISLDPGSGEYIALGTVEDSNGEIQMFSVGFDDGGTINWQYAMDDYSNNFKQMIPVNMTLATNGTSSYPVVVGHARSSNYQLLFSGRIDPSTGAMYWFRSYYLWDGSNYAKSTAGDICQLSSTQLAVAFTSEGILPSTGTNSLVCYMPLDLSFSPSVGVSYTYHTLNSGITHDYHFGVGIYENSGDLDIGVRFSDVSGSIWDGVPGFLNISSTASVLNAIAYNSHSPYFETGMVRHGDGYWIKSRREDDKFNLNGVDFNGKTQTNCDWAPNWKVNKVKVDTKADEVTISTHGTNSNYSLNDASVNGVNYACNSSTGVSFKKDATVSIEDAAVNNSVYPSLVSNSDVIRVSSGEFNGQNVSIVVSNALGQILFTQNSDAKEGDVFTISAAELSQGMNLVTVTNANGEQIINTRVIKQ